MHRDVYQCVEMYKKVYKCIQMYTDVNKSIQVRNTLKGCIFFGDSQYNHPFSVFPENTTKNASRKIPFVNEADCIILRGVLLEADVGVVQEDERSSRLS